MVYEDRQPKKTEEDKDLEMPYKLRPFMPPFFTTTEAQETTEKKIKKMLKKQLKNEHDLELDEYKEEKRPQNEFYDAFVHYNLLKKKIDFRIFETADDLIDETLDVVERINKLRAHNFFETELSYGSAEFAYIMFETAETLYQWIEEKSADNNWLREFVPKNQATLEQFMECTVQYLGQAGFDLPAV